MNIKFQFIYKGLPFSGSDGGFRYHKKVYSLCQLEDRSLHEMSDVHGTCDLIASRQYTGLQDKNGVDIYEGDILRQVYESSKISDDVGIVKWGSYEDGEYVSCVQCWEACGCPVSDNGGLHGGAAHEWEVIGNIFEDKELLDVAT